jgi:uncharacterized YccA/Bax inhibitor family protein
MAVISTNPALRSGFDHPGTPGWASSAGDRPFSAADVMTLRGTVAKTALCLALLTAAGAVGWTLDLPGAVVLVMMLAMFVLSIVISRKPTVARGGALVYAVVEGAAMGAVSRWYADGRVIAGADGAALVWSALGLTIAITLGLLAVYATGLIKPSANFRLALAAATIGIALFYVATIAMSLMGFAMPLVHSTSGWGIAFSVFVVVLASACLVVDFDFVERGVEARMPKHMEWYAAFGLMVTLVWLYLEMLRLLAKLQARR